MNIINPPPHAPETFPVSAPASNAILKTILMSSKCSCVLILFAALWRKLQHEERWMGEAFGEDYAKYRSEVAALIPFVI